jgi:hypothetical protein
MSIEHEITKHAAEGSLTIAELRQFVDEFDVSTRADPDRDPGGLKPKVRSGLGGGIKSITVKIPGGDERK